MATSNLLSKYRKSAVIITTILTLGSVITASNVIFGLNVRPAWAYELASLNIKQLHIQIKQFNADRREYNRDLAKYKVLASEYIRGGESAPDWLIQAIADTEEDIKKLDEEKAAAQQQILQGN